jgi:tetraacyldisaccharide 4'-kinase
LGTRFRNHLYNIDHKKSFQFDTNVIAVGNLSVGGTGKTPVVEYILRLLSKYELATLSRGYGRNTKGFKIAGKDDSALTLGDEPFQFYQKFPKVMVTVGEDRSMAIPQIIYHNENTEVVVLDDAYQHRSVIPNLNILLTEFDKPFFKDYILPAGRLREARKNANRADVVVITKCPDEILDKDETSYLKAVAKYTSEKIPVFFSKVAYQIPQIITGKSNDNFKQVFVFTGIANELPFMNYLKDKYEVIGELHHSDHYKYELKDVEKIINEYDKVKSDSSVLITTEKDMVRLLGEEFKGVFEQRSAYYIPIAFQMIKNGSEFDGLILNSIKTKSIHQ